MKDLRKKLTDKDKAKIKSLFSTGMIMKEISKQFPKVSYQYVRMICRGIA